jgi:predicted ATPase/class 3 adenylate cyclase/DNA-binding winged helix-turn-helix (wHTH) protein
MIYAFGEYVLDTQRHMLRRAGQGIRVRRKVFQALTYLLAHHDRAVSKQELCEQIWPQQFISDAALESTIKGVRQAIGDSGRGQQFIQTVYGYGYRFIAAVGEHSDAPTGTEDGARLSPRDTGPAHSQDTYDMAFVPPRQGVTEDDDARWTMPVTAEESFPPRDTITSTAEWKMVTVLCCGLAEASTRFTPEEPDARYRQIRELYLLAQDVVQGYEGTLQPVVGECVMAVFGAPQAQEDHAQRAVLAALELQRRVHEAGLDDRCQPGDRLGPRVGLHTGQVAVGGISDSPARLTVVGDTVTRAITLQAEAAPGAILCGDTTARLVQGMVWVEALGPALVAGESTPVTAYTILGRRVQDRPIIHREARALTPFVGRWRELGTLHAMLARAMEGRGQVVGVVGEPGIGKSRLVYEFHQSLHGKPLTYLASSCVSHGAASPYLPVLPLLRQYCSLVEGDSLAAITAKVCASLEEVGLPPEPWASYLLQLFELPVEMDLLATHSPQAVKAHTVEALVQLALHGARRRPLVLEVENLHWIDPTSEEVLCALVEQLVGARILLLLTYRPGYRPPWIEKSYVSQLALARLVPRDSRRLVQTVLRTTPIPETVVQAMLTRAEGNPLFLEELAHTAMEQGDSHRMAGVPTTIQAVLATRIDRLPLETKRLLQMAAVIGKDVPVTLLQSIAGLPDAALQRGLAHLQTVELLYETTRGADRALTFKHALIQEAAYHSLLKSTRLRYHQQIAQMLAERFPETIKTQPELLAHHYTEGWLPTQAVPAWLRAGQRAGERSAHIEAIEHLTRGLEVLKTLPDAPERTQLELVLQTTLGPALMATKGYAAPEVECAYARARELCQQVGETPQLFQALWGLWYFHLVRAEFRTARALGEQLLDLAQRVQAPGLLLLAHRVLGQTLTFLGEFSAAQVHLERGMTLYQPERYRSLASLYGQDQGVICRSWAALALWYLGYPDQALRRSREALSLSQELAHPFSLAYAICFAGMFCQLRREVQTAQERATAEIALCSEQGFALYLARGTILRGWAMAEQGRGAEGLAQMRQGLDAYQATGAEVFRPYYLACLAIAHGKVGQAEEGLSRLAEALAAVHKTGERIYEAELFRLKGELLLAVSPDRDAEAEACFHQALSVARRQQAKALELRAAMSLSRLWQCQSRRTAAQELLGEVYSWFTEGLDTADFQEAKGLLAELGRSESRPRA